MYLKAEKGNEYMVPTGKGKPFCEEKGMHFPNSYSFFIGCGLLL